MNDGASPDDFRANLFRDREHPAIGEAPSKIMGLQGSQPPLLWGCNHSHVCLSFAQACRQGSTGGGHGWHGSTERLTNTALLNQSAAAEIGNRVVLSTPTAKEGYSEAAGVEQTEGSPLWGAKGRAAALYSVGSTPDPDHEAADALRQRGLRDGGPILGTACRPCAYSAPPPPIDLSAFCDYMRLRQPVLTF
jgi:hypothetical protein